MITGFFLQVLTTLITFFVMILPVIAVPQGWLDAISLVWGYINAMSFLLPISTLLQILGLVVVIEVFLFIYHFSLKVYHLVRGK